MVADVKLARTAKARAVLQTASYSRLLPDCRDRVASMHLALVHREFVSFKVGDFAAYERQTRRRLADGSPRAQTAHGVLYGLPAGRHRVGWEIDLMTVRGHEVVDVASAQLLPSG